jgi:hypothetical protein
MMTNSPLGQYAPLVATVTSLMVIGGYIAALILPLNVNAASLSQLQSIAFIAIGAIFGSAVSVNGWKQPLTAIHQRLDAAHIPAAAGDPPVEAT